MRVIADLVPNHTSVEHPWFQYARKGPDSPFHDWYVWSDNPPPVAPADVAFPGEETEHLAVRRGVPAATTSTGSTASSRTWTSSNPEVRDELTRIAGFWTELGIDGSGWTPCRPSCRATTTRRRPGCPTRTTSCATCAPTSAAAGRAFLLGEANLPHDQQRKFFGDGSSPELSGSFDFITMANLWLSMARGEAARSRTPSSPARRSRRSASGRRSCATTTS